MPNKPTPPSPSSPASAEWEPLRALIAKWRGLRTSKDAFLSASAYGTYEMAADELETLAPLLARKIAEVRLSEARWWSVGACDSDCTTGNGKCIHERRIAELEKAL